MILKGYIFSILYAAIVVAVGMLLSKLGVPKKYTRKFVHIFVGFEWVILFHFMGSPSVHFLAVCLIFFALLFCEYKLKFIPAMSSDGDNAPGTVYYAVAMSVLAFICLFVPDMIYPFGVAVFCTSLGDGLAGVLGQAIKKHNPKIYGNKSLIGTVAVFIVCFASAHIFDNIFSLGIGIIGAASIAVFSSEIELFVGKGLDNIALTLGSAFLTFGISFYPEITYSLIAPILLTPAVIAFAYKKKALTLGGIITAIIMDIAVSLALGNFGFVLLLSFLVLGIVADKLKKKIKSSRPDFHEKEKRSDRRDHIQVLANGLVPSLCAILFITTGARVFAVAYCAALAEALADTVASGIGIAAKNTYDPFRMRRCESGISGGMSVIGTAASLVGSLIISAIALAFGQLSILEAVLVLVCGFLGAIFDSFLGSLVQVKYRCPLCASLIEREEHCGEKTEKISGIKFVNNDFVNLSSTVFSALVCSLLFMLWF